MRIPLTPEQCAVIGQRVYRGPDPAPCELLDYDELTRIGLDLPPGTVELLQGDSFTSITPCGDVIEEGGGITRMPREIA